MPRGPASLLNVVGHYWLWGFLSLLPKSCSTQRLCSCVEQGIQLGMSTSHRPIAPTYGWQKTAKCIANSGPRCHRHLDRGQVRHPPLTHLGSHITPPALNWMATTMLCLRLTQTLSTPHPGPTRSWVCERTGELVKEGVEGETVNVLSLHALENTIVPSVDTYKNKFKDQLLLISRRWPWNIQP